MARILVIEDEPLVRELLEATVKNAGHEVAVAADGDEGLKLYRDRPADVVITDIFMPEKEGLETIEQLRRVHPAVKVIAISGGSPLRQIDVLSWATLMGASFTFRKPVDRAELLQAIDKCLNGTGDQKAAPRSLSE